VIESVKIRLGAPNYPKDTMIFSGEVTEVEPPGQHGRGAVTISLRGRNSLGNHVTGVVRVALPSKEEDGVA
jgi:acyl dehydratase